MAHKLLKCGDWPYPVRLDGKRSILSQLPLHIALRMRARIQWANLCRIAHILEKEIRSLVHRSRVQLHKMEYLPTKQPVGMELIPTHPGSNIWKPSSIEHIRQAMVEKPWASLFDLSLCLEGWEAAIECARRHTADSCREQIEIQTSDSLKPL
jgi:hypothetical protein